MDRGFAGLLHCKLQPIGKIHEDRRTRIEQDMQRLMSRFARLSIWVILACCANACSRQKDARTLAKIGSAYCLAAAQKALGPDAVVMRCSHLEKGGAL